jgi:hypothetical protein
MMWITRPCVALGWFLASTHHITLLRLLLRWPSLCLQGNTLVKVTFFDGLQMVSGLALVKDFLLLGQAGHSAAFFRYNCTPDPVTR